jgi:hypothetical protein
MIASVCAALTRRSYLSCVTALGRAGISGMSASEFSCDASWRAPVIQVAKRYVELAVPETLL